MRAGSLRRSRSKSKSKTSKNSSQETKFYVDCDPGISARPSISSVDSNTSLKKRRKVVKQSSLRLASRNVPLKGEKNEGEISKLVRRLSSRRKSQNTQINEKGDMVKSKQRLNKINPNTIVDQAISTIRPRNPRMFAPEEDFTLDDPIPTKPFLDRVQMPTVKLKESYDQFAIKTNKNPNPKTPENPTDQAGKKKKSKKKTSSQQTKRGRIQNSSMKSITLRN